MEVNKQKYRTFSATESTIPVFSKGWWLDAELGTENWDVITIVESGNIIASLPYQIPKGIIKKSGMPLLGQTLGPWISQKYIERSKYQISTEFQLIECLFRKLPYFDYFIQQLHWTRKNHLPLYWMGYKQETVYTHIIKDISNIEYVITNFHTNKKRHLKQALKKYSLADIGPEKFYDHYENFLQQKGKKIQYSWGHFMRVYSAAMDNKSGKIFCAIDSQNSICSCLFVVWDPESAYHLITPINPQIKQNSSLTFLIVEAIKYLQNKTLRYDFEGSMIQPIEKSFREYGGELIPYHRVKKTNNVLLKCLDFLRNQITSQT